MQHTQASTSPMPFPLALHERIADELVVPLIEGGIGCPAEWVAEEIASRISRSLLLEAIVDAQAGLRWRIELACQHTETEAHKAWSDQLTLLDAVANHLSGQ
jgi:hypothetical protein